jgi:hypothetical protein
VGFIAAVITNNPDANSDCDRERLPESYAWWARSLPGAHLVPSSIASLRETGHQELIEAMQITMQIGGPDAQRQFLADQMRLWGPVVKEHNIKSDS